MRKVLSIETRSKFVKKLKRLTLILIINAAFLIPLTYGFELFLKWRDPKRTLPANGIVNGRFFTWGHAVENNKFGFREREFEMPKPSGTFRIMVLGDSLTWGVGLAPEERYTNRLEKSLNDTYRGKKFEVLNFAHPGDPTTIERDDLRKYEDLVQPDLIIVGFCINDPQPRGQDYSVERARYERRLDSLSYRLGTIGLTEIGDLSKAAVYGFLERTNMIPRWEKALDRAYVESSPEWQGFLKALRDIKQTSDRRKLPPPIFAVLNLGARVGHDYVQPDERLSAYLRWEHQAEKAAGEIGFRTVNYEKEIPVELSDDSMMVNFADGHPSAKVNQLYATKLFGVVVDGAGLNSTGPVKH